MTQQEKRDGILSEGFKERQRKILYFMRNDTGAMIWTFFGIIVGYFILIGFLMAPAAVGVTTYIDNLLATYPGFPVNQSLVYILYLFIFRFTVAWCILSLVVVTIYLVAWATPDPTGKKTGNAPKNSPKKVHKKNGARIPCPVCTSTKTRKAGKEHEGEMFCMTCRKYFRK